MKLSSLASSSEGNCIYVGTKKTNVLVDCGVSAKRIENSLSELDLTVPEFDGILITHEHTDHIKGLATFCKKYDVPIYASFGTSAAIQMKLPQAQRLLQPFAPDCCSMMPKIGLMERTSVRWRLQFLSRRLRGSGVPPVMFAKFG